MALSKKYRVLFKKPFNNNTPLIKRYGYLLGIICNPNNKEENFRMSVVVGKKIDKRAVARNLIKRKISRVFAEIIKDNDIKPCDILVIPKKEAIEKNTNELKIEIVKFLENNKLFLNDQKISSMFNQDLPKK